MAAARVSRLTLRVIAIAVVVALTGLVFLLRDIVSPEVRGGLGILTFIGIVAACSPNLAAVNWRTVGWGMALQVGLALFILKFEINGWRPGYEFFARVADGVKKFLEFTNAGSQFVFGGLADPVAMSKVFPGGFIFAFVGLPTIIFVSAFFTLLY
jgi:CNT family concentrative nucleoside transporter